MRQRTSCQEVTGSPLIARMVSPDSKPAPAAGVPDGGKATTGRASCTPCMNSSQ